MAKKYLILFVAMIAGCVYADPIVLADFGGKPTELSKMKDSAANYQAPGSPSMISRPSQFPLYSRKLNVGEVETHKHQQKVITPVFIAGVDSLSLEWLRTNQAYLKKIGAKGIITNVATGGDFEKLKSMVPELNLNAVPVDQIAEVYGITHYPVLIDKEDIRQ